MPAATLVIGTPEIVGGAFDAGGVTTMVNAGSETAAWPSLTEITMSANVPTFATSGVPVNLPSVGLNVAQAGRLRIENVSASLFGSLAVGLNVYAAPATTDTAGVPEIVGGPFVPDDVLLTVRSKAGNSVCCLPSDTQMTTPRYTPTFALVGVPLSCPVLVLNIAQTGLASTPKISGSPSGSVAAGVKE